MLHLKFERTVPTKYALISEMMICLIVSGKQTPPQTILEISIEFSGIPENDVQKNVTTLMVFI